MSLILSLIQSLDKDYSKWDRSYVLLYSPKIMSLLPLEIAEKLSPSIMIVKRLSFIILQFNLQTAGFIDILRARECLHDWF